MYKLKLEATMASTQAYRKAASRISPKLTRSYTRIHASQSREPHAYAGSHSNTVRSNPPFLTSESWHPTQCFPRKPLTSGTHSSPKHHTPPNPSHTHHTNTSSLTRLNPQLHRTPLQGVHTRMDVVVFRNRNSTRGTPSQQ